VNYPPITSDATVTGYENTPLTVNLVASDDPNGINSNVAMQITIAAFPTSGSLSTASGTALTPANPTVVLSLNNGVPVSVIYTPNANQASTADSTGALQMFDFFSYTATNADGLSSSGSIRLLVTPAASQPTVSFSNSAWSFPLATIGSQHVSHICLSVGNLQSATNTAVYITTLPTKGSVSVNNVAATTTPVALAPSSVTLGGASGSWCFDYTAKKAGTDSVVVKVCQGCPQPSAASFQNYLAAAPTQTVNMQVGSQKAASSSGLSKGGVIAVAVVAAIIAIVLLVVGIVAYRARSNSVSNSKLKTPLL